MIKKILVGREGETHHCLLLLMNGSMLPVDRVPLPSASACPISLFAPLSTPDWE